MLRIRHAAGLLSEVLDGRVVAGIDVDGAVAITLHPHLAVDLRKPVIGFARVPIGMGGDRGSIRVAFSSGIRRLAVEAECV
jgi:hypothetical protein